MKNRINILNEIKFNENQLSIINIITRYSKLASKGNLDTNIYYSEKKTNTQLRKKNKKQWEKIFKEDISVVEGMQKGRNSIHFDGGKFSPVMDGPTHCFHKWVASHLLTSENNLNEKQ